MKNMTLENIAKACNGRLELNNSDDLQKEVSSVIIDSRKCEEGCAFVATKGERVDGHSFINQVWENGALLVICESEPECKGGNYIVVEDSFKALKDIAEFYRMQLPVKIIGIVGSVGKTSTKEIVSSVISTKYSVQKTAGNFNNEVGVPLTIFTIDESHDVAVVEMGISDFGEMRRLSKIVKPDLVVMTNIGPCHLEQLKDLDGVLRAKSEVFEYINKQGYVIANGEDDKLKTLNGVCENKVIFFGRDDSFSVHSKNINNKGLEGTECTICTEKGEFEVLIPIPGEHMVYNALAATAAGLCLGLEIEDIKNGIAKAKGISGRSNIIVKDDCIVIDDCYNANPKSMKAAIDLLCTSGKENIAIIGDMFELGDDEESLHAEIGKYISDKCIDMVICIGRLSNNIYENILNNTVKKYYFEELEDCMDKLNSIISDKKKNGKPAILVKASHGMHLEKLLDIL